MAETYFSPVPCHNCLGGFASFNSTSDGNGLLIHNFTKGTGQSDVHRMTIQNGKLVYGDTEQTFSMGDSEWDKFGEENPEATWTAISDKSKIEELQ